MRGEACARFCVARLPRWKSRTTAVTSRASFTIQMGRIASPVAAGVMIVSWGVAACLVVNAVSCGLLLAALAAIDVTSLHRHEPRQRARRESRRALAYVGARSQLWTPLATLAIVGALSLNLTVLVPLLAGETYDGSAGSYAVLSVAVGAGSVGGALAAAATRAPGTDDDRRVSRRRRSLRAARRRSEPLAVADHRAGLGRRGSGGLLRSRQLAPAAHKRPRDARPRDGALRDRPDRGNHDRRPP